MWNKVVSFLPLFLTPFRPFLSLPSLYKCMDAINEESRPFKRATMVKKL